MKILCFALMFGAFPLVCFSQKPASPSLTGKVFSGIKDTTDFEPGCEGCGNAGYFEFLPNQEVEFLTPGSDIIEMGVYEQVGRWVYVSNMELKFNAAADTLFDQKYGTPFVLKRDED